MSKSLAMQWEGSSDQRGWTCPGTSPLLFTMTLAWLWWFLGGAVAAAVWFAVRRESVDDHWPLGDGE